MKFGGKGGIGGGPFVKLGGGVGGGPWSGIWSNHGQGPCRTWLRQRRLVRSSMYQCMDHVLDPVLGVLRMAEPWAGPWKLHPGVVAAQRTRAGTLCWTRCPVCCIQVDGTEGVLDQGLDQQIRCTHQDTWSYTFGPLVPDPVFGLLSTSLCLSCSGLGRW